MATSGTTAFDLSVDELIEEAYERCGIKGRVRFRKCKRSLNIMMADWANREQSMDNRTTLSHSYQELTT